MTRETNRHDSEPTKTNSGTGHISPETSIKPDTQVYYEREYPNLVPDEVRDLLEKAAEHRRNSKGSKLKVG